MPIRLNAVVCVRMGGRPISPDECEITRDFIAHLANRLTLDEFGKSYLTGLYQIRDGEDDYIVQGKYIANNALTETNEEKEAWFILSHLEKGKPLPKYNPRDNIISEIEYGHIYEQVERFTERKERVSLQDFKDFAEMKGYPLDVALVCNPWVDEHLTEDAKKAIHEAKKKIKIEWD